MDVSLVTTNEGKVRETREVLAPFGVRLTWRRRELVEPQAEALDHVVRSKLDQLKGLKGYVLVEDSGLFIPSLGGFPGVYSAHIYRIWGFAPILELLERRPRKATFRTVAGLRRGTRSWMFVGECHGEVVAKAAGDAGFGFDPIFRPDGSDLTFASMAPEVKNQFSHRAKAMRGVGDFLQKAGKAGGGPT
jgi:XTP/dITP diphosphohydrolase